MTDAIPLPLDVSELESEVAGGATLRRTILPSGVRILTEYMPGSHSVAVGYWVPVGSRDEQPHQYGSTHFLEHLLFKGTPSRNAFDIAIAFDRVGGDHNAATSREHTVYHATVRDEDLPMALELLSDMLTSSLIDPQEFETERGVILEELSMADDDPTDVLWDRFYGTALGAHPLGRPIGGTKESIEAVSRTAVWDHYRATYAPNDLVVTIAGNVDHDAAVALVESTLRAGGWDLDTPASPVERRDRSLATVTPLERVTTIPRDLEQANILIGTTGLQATDPRRHAFSLFHRIFGGGMSSRLFQEVREKRGLAYSVHSFASAFADLGITGMYTGTAPGKALESVKVLRGELVRVLAEGITETELADAKGAVKGATVLALEDTEARMSRLGRAEITLGEFVDLDATVARVNAIEVDEVNAVARDVFSTPLVATTIGPVSEAVRNELAS